jgi:histidyl-tRNA synthetase
VDVPVLEHTDLYLRKAGEDIIARLYDFTFQGRRLCLRPEMTASVIRAYVDSLQSNALPLRLCYAGPVFRYEKPQRGRHRQFTQAGVELLGAGGALADAEVIALAIKSLDALGLTDYQVVLGHVGILARFLESLQLDSRLRDFLMTNIELLRAQGADAVREKLPALFPSFSQPAPDLPAGIDPSLAAHLAEMDETAARGMVLDLLKSMDIELDSSRSPDEIVNRLLAKIKRGSQAPRLDQALKFLSELSPLTGSPEQVLRDAEGLLAGYDIGLDALHELRAIFDMLANYGLDLSRITLDLGLSRGLQYYTGMIFEIYHGVPGEESQLCGGGRYDDLAQTLGARKSVAGCGFSFGVERIQLALADAGRLSIAAQPVQALVIAVGSQESAYAIRAAGALRQAGLRAELDVRGRSVTSNLQYANGQHIPFVVVAGSEEMEANRLRLKTMSTGAEQRLTVAEVISAIKEFFL